MPIHVTWYDEESHNIVYRFEGLWSWDDCHEAINKAASLLEELDYPVIQIVDLRKSYYAPPVTLEGLSNIAQGAAPNHPNAKFVIVIGLKGTVLMAFNVFKQIFPQAGHRYIVAHSDADLAKFLNGEGTTSKH